MFKVTIEKTPNEEYVFEADRYEICNGVLRLINNTSDPLRPDKSTIFPLGGFFKAVIETTEYVSQGDK